MWAQAFGLTQRSRQVESETSIMEVVFKDQRGAGIDWTLFNGILDPPW